MNKLLLLVTLLLLTHLKVSEITINMRSYQNSRYRCMQDEMIVELELKYTGVTEGAWFTAICQPDFDSDSTSNGMANY